MKSTCRRCGKTYVYDRSKGHRKTICNSCNVVIARQRQKEKAVEYMGGSCRICGYDRHQGSLVFHHRDSEEKDFNLSQEGVYRAWKVVLQELDKCVLVYRNCHGETHGGLHPEYWEQSRSELHWSEFRTPNEERQFEHGTSSGYGYHKCRCAECTEYQRRRCVRYRKRRRENEQT